MVLEIFILLFGVMVIERHCGRLAVVILYRLLLELGFLSAVGFLSLFSCCRSDNEL